MSVKPEKIYAYPGSLIYSLKPADPHTVEYIRADLLKDDKWLADNGLKRFCKKCNGEGKTPIYTNLGGDMYLSHYEPCECVAVVSFP